MNKKDDVMSGMTNAVLYKEHFKNSEFVDYDDSVDYLNGHDISTMNPTKLGVPAYAMNIPFSYQTEEPNNIFMDNIDEFMQKYEDSRVEVNHSRAIAQLNKLYSSIVAQGVIVYLVPTPHNVKLQDLVFCANGGIVLSHLEDKRTAIVSNFTSGARYQETHVIASFLQSMGYHTIVSPYSFEGEADLKHLYDNVYIGGYGIHSQKETYDWMEQNFDMKIIKLHMNDPYLYHLDCSIFPITQQQTLVATEAYKKTEINLIEKHTEIIDIPLNMAKTTLTNSVRVKDMVFNDTFLFSIKKTNEYYEDSKKKHALMEKICSRFSLKPVFFDLSEFDKAGAALSCLVLHLNRHSYH